MAIPSRRLGRSPRSPAPATAPARNERLAPLAAYTQRMNRVLDHIDKHLDESLEVAALAAIAHFSPFHFHRVFTAWMGETLGDYLRRRRIEVAAARLEQVLVEFSDQSRVVIRSSSPRLRRLAWPSGSEGR